MSKNGTLDDSQLQYFEQQKKKSYFSLLLRSKKSILWHFSENPTKR